MLYRFIVFVIPFLISVVLGAYIIPRMRLVFTTNNNLTEGNGMQKVARRTTKIGGLAFFPLLLVAFCVALAMPRLIGDADLMLKVEESAMRILQVISGLAIMYVVGIKDDIHGTSTKNVFLGVLFASLMFPASGLWINNLHGLFWVNEIPRWIGMPLTVLVAMYLTVLVKLMDGVDGLGSGISSLSLMIFIAFSLFGGFAIAGIIASAALGLAFPFWIMKVGRKRDKTILGSTGSYILGYVIAYLAIGLSRQGGGTMPEGMIIICFSAIMIPAIDIMRVIRSRVNDSRDLLVADKNQINHKLVRTGMGRNSVVVALIVLSLFYVGVTCLLVNQNINLTYILILDLVLYVLTQYVLNYFIHKAETQSYHRSWNKVYGEEAWNADIPEDTLKEKMATYGTMGLPSHIIEGNDITFIPDGMNSIERELKRLFDLIVSGCCLIVFSPLFLLSYVMIKLDDGGPAIFRQERIGRFGRPFYILKYRSMRLDAEKFGPALSHAGGDDDPRLTKVGKFIRAHHLDELPQLWNVFKGEMSLIGYRPERKFYIDQIMENDPRYAFLYQIRPGITSYATLYNGYTDTMEKMLRRLELDLYYLGHRSWWLDMKVLMLTFLSIVSGKKF